MGACNCINSTISTKGELQMDPTRMKELSIFIYFNYKPGE